MADLESTDVTVTVGENYIQDKKKIVNVTVAFGDGSLTYPSGGVPMPSFLSFGLGRSLDHLRLVDPANANGYLYKWDRTNKKLRIYQGAAVGSHTHAVALDGGDTGAEAAHTHVTVDQFAAAAEILNVTKGTPKLTHAADPSDSATDGPIFAVESYGAGGRNILQLQSICASNADVLGAVDDASGACGAATAFFLITDNDTPAGVQIYIDEADNDRLKFVSPTATDGYIIMPFECLTTSLAGFAYAIKVTHDAGAGSMKPLYFNDNAAADAQLVWTDTGTSDGVIYAADIEVLGPSYYSVNLATGVSGAGSSHTHDEGTLVDAASAANSAVAATALTELASGSATPAAATLKGEAVGW